jgi:hypothetical protein
MESVSQNNLWMIDGDIVAAGGFSFAAAAPARMRECAVGR